MSLKQKIIGAVLTVVAVVTGTSSAAFASTYNGTTINPAADGQTYTVAASAGDTVTLNNAGQQGGAHLAITFKNNVSGTIVITPSSTLPTGAGSVPSGTVATYYNVTLNGLTDNDIATATWTYNVATSFLTNLGLSSSNVFLEHWNGASWDRLSTSVVSTSSSTDVFSSTVSSLSPFAVVAVPGLSNTGVPYALIAAIAVGAIAVVTGSFFLSRKKKQSNL